MDIAYQVFGDGPVDLVVLPWPFIPIDSIDAEPSMYHFHRRLASFCRVIRFDQRGMGLSSRIPSLDVIGPTYWAEDAIAVMDAVGCAQATIFAPFNAAAMGALVLAADYPDRVRSLVVVNGAVRVTPSARLCGRRRHAPRRQVHDGCDGAGCDEPGIRHSGILAPSVARDGSFRIWWAPRNRAASPSMARAVARILAEADVRDALERITARSGTP